MRVSLSRRQFQERCQSGNLVPVYRQLLGDTFTPISIFLKFGGDRLTNSFLLESVVNGERLGRHTFLGVEARAVLRGSNSSFEKRDASGTISHHTGDPLAILSQEFGKLRPVPDSRLPLFHGGAVGFLSYDVIRYYENLPDNNPDPVEQEDVYLVFADELIVFDHVERNIRLIVNVRTDEYQSVDEAYDRAIARLDEMEGIMKKADPGGQEIMRATGKMTVESNMSAEDYKSAVVKAREYIYAGDIFQVVLSKRFSFRPGVPPFQIYRALRSINPSPYMYYLNLGPYSVVGSSPEILVRLQENRVVLRPIAGTRRRGKSEEQDLELERDLLSDQKEIAEHIMLVDLGRNDAGRVCAPGSVRVTEFKVIERYSHVMHIVSNCEGDLKEGMPPYDVLRAAMPAGTVSGAPKIRAMEIIDELETVRRGIYAGCIGYFGYSGDFDTAIAIRTMIIKDDVCHLQAGAGIVFDSDPEKECDEVANKVRGMLKAVSFARRGLT